MSHSFSNLLIHIIFSTKERRRLINSEIRPQLFAYMGGIVREMKCKPIIIGGVEDHVHLLVGFTVNESIAHMMSVLKANSSKWIHETYRMPFFEWQRGYAAFTVSQSVSIKVERYIARQEEHHKRKSYKEELSDFFRANGIDVPRYE